MATPEEIHDNLITHLPNLAEQALNLPEMVRNDERLRLSDANGPQNAPRNIGKYGLVGMVDVKGIGGDPDRLRGGGEYIMRSNVVPHHEGYDPRKRPLLEGPAALGLTVQKDGKEHLCAVATARVNSDGSLEIVQIQGTNTDGELKSQLGGFRWSTALVRLWEEAASYIGAEELVVTETSDHISAQAEKLEAAGDPYYTRQNDSYRRNYDGAAERAGLRKSSGKKGWRRKVEPKPMPRLGGAAIQGSSRSVGAVRRAICIAADGLTHGEGGHALGRAWYYAFEAGYEIDAGDMDVEYPAYFPHVSGGYQDALKKVEEAIAAVQRAVEAMRNFEQKL